MNNSENSIVEKQEITVEEAIEKVKKYLSDLYYGYEEDIDPIQAQTLLVFMQVRNFEIAHTVTLLYYQLQEKNKEFKKEYYKTREELSNEEYLSNKTEKKIENECLQKNENLLNLKIEIENLKLAIEAYNNENKYLSYLIHSWENVIQRILIMWKRE